MFERKTDHKLEEQINTSETRIVEVQATCVSVSEEIAQELKMVHSMNWPRQLEKH